MLVVLFLSFVFNFKYQVSWNKKKKKCLEDFLVSVPSHLTHWPTNAFFGTWTAFLLKFPLQLIEGTNIPFKLNVKFSFCFFHFFSHLFHFLFFYYLLLLFFLLLLFSKWLFSLVEFRILVIQWVFPSSCFSCCFYFLFSPCLSYLFKSFRFCVNAILVYGCLSLLAFNVKCRRA